MSTFVSDSLNGTNWNDLHLRSGAVGATWTRHPAAGAGGGSSRWYIYGNRVHCGVFGAMYASGVPASADYTVSCDYIVYTTVTSPSSLNLGIAGRMSTTDDTYYALYYQAGETVLIKRVAGVTTSLGTWISTLSGGGTTYQFQLSMIGTAIKAYVNGVERISVTDGAITAAGKAGLRSIGINDASTGNHIDNFVATDTSVPPTGRSQVIGIVGL